TLTYTIKVDDGNGGTVTQDVAIVVTGTNDTPVIATTSNLAPLITEVPIPDPLPPGSDTAAVQEIAPAMSVDGRWVVFFSDEQLPNSGNSSDKGDVYLYDRLTDTTTVLTDDAHIPVKQPGELFSGFSISDDGGTVVFRGEYATGNPPGNGPSNVSLIYVYDRTTDTTSVLTNPATNTPFNVNDEPRIAHNQIVFASTDFGNNTAPPTYHIYVTDLSGNIQTDILPGTVGITEPVNPDDAIQFQQPDISGNGRYVTFWTVENVFDPNTNTDSQVGNATLYTYDRTTGSYQTIATTSGSDGNNWWASMSNDGRYVVFQSDSDALDAQAGGHANGHMDIFVWDRSTGDITGITENATVHSDGASLRPSISANGDEIIFASDAANLVPGDTNGLGDTFVYDTQNHTFQRLSVAGDGTQGNGDSTLGSDLSFDGTFAAFGSTASNLVPGDTNVTSDIFIVDRSGGGVTGAVTEQPGTNNPGDDTVMGTITFTDVDLSDHHTVTVTGVSASGVTSGLPDNATILDWVSLGTLTDTTGSGLGGSQPWGFSAQDKNFDYLAAGETLTLTYAVQVDDHNGGVVSQDVVILVTGTNDTPVITVSGTDSAAATLTESQIPLSKMGTLTVTDVDLSDTVTAAVTGVTLGGTTGGLTNAAVLGMLTVPSGSIAADPTDTHNLQWTFDSDPQTFNFLSSGETLTLT